ncbi:hypothetical protein NLJ89_g6072 [Agrocybe chaxingu]|uniref:Uncharacterized protein n=1 Tax=Agrocybe chaxingu TaxID=84603 RepID=A0A9W8JZ01_9AGAR|nr:hypothetical protein NLJ89_g6072 [Agrocybe chaxingu]
MIRLPSPPFYYFPTSVDLDTARRPRLSFRGYLRYFSARGPWRCVPIPIAIPILIPILILVLGSSSATLFQLHLFEDAVTDVPGLSSVEPRSGREGEPQAEAVRHASGVKVECKYSQPPTRIPTSRKTRTRMCVLVVALAASFHDSLTIFSVRLRSHHLHPTAPVSKTRRRMEDQIL